MAAGRSLKTLVSRRRRAGTDEEEDEGPVLVEDSQSEGSVLSEMDDEEAASSLGDGQPADASEVGEKAPEPPRSAANGSKHGKKPRKARKDGSKKQSAEPDKDPATVFKTTADTEAMMNGLQVRDQEHEVLDFEATGSRAAVSPSPYPIATSAGRPKSTAERQRREHEEYKKKRDANPAFIPNRGNFFMHDTRGQQNGQGPAPARGGMAGRGRGRGGPQVGGPYSPAGQMARADKSSGPLWEHDLHESINETAPARDAENAANIFPRSVQQQRAGAPTPISFSHTTLLGRVQLRVFLPNMKAPVVFPEVPAKKYVRLPDHRPPLRRDKPVRIFLPNTGPKYIFPSTERSFIFIPRQMRPNQRGFGSNYQRSIGGYGYSSRRTSMYGGSMYSASVAPSRRSSITRDRENMFSPSSFVGGFQPPNRPVVRLPYGGQFFSSSTTSPAGPLSGQHTPTTQLHTYPLPQQPTFQGTPTTTVQHPRPQKAISMSGIESPVALGQQAIPADQQQPFHSQLPPHMANQAQQQQQQQQGNAPYFSPHQQYAYPVGAAAQSATPLSRIPEHAIHAQNFQPPQGMYYAPYAPTQQPYYYAQAPVPMYAMPQQPQTYMQPSATQPRAMPQSMPAQQGPADKASDVTPDQNQQANSGMVAHESNGMVYYLPASEAATQPSSNEQYQPAEGFVPSYAMPGLPPPTPAPDASGYYYMGGMQNMGYYQPMQQGQ